jgi:phospholipase C
MSSPFTTNISILNALGNGLSLTNSVTPSLDPTLWGSLSNSVPNAANATQVLGFNRDKHITPGDTWTFTTAFTLDGVTVQLQEQMTGTTAGSKMSQSMTADSVTTGFRDTTDSISINFTGISDAVYALRWDLALHGNVYYSIQYTITVVTPAYQPITPVMPQVETIVMIMMENRSLDNVLGWLYNGSAPAVIYPPGSSTTFDGIPANVSNSYKTTSYSPQNGTHGYNNPWRVPAYDPGEPMPDVEVQLYGDSQGNTPSNPWSQAPGMQGFAFNYYADYVDSVGEVMGAYSAAQLPVLYGLAQNFAVSDRWFASAPTQTDPNRAFSICGTSLGAEVNSDISSTTFQNANTIFNVLGSSGKTWGMYWQMDNPLATGEPLTSYAPFTSYYFPRMNEAPNGSTAGYKTFLQAAASGILPNFCYIEPYWGGGKGVPFDQNDWIGIQGNDYHPPAWVGPAENDLNTLYQTLVDSPQWPSMLFIITFDEHGGNWDHVPPTPTVSPDASVGLSGFTFNRLGVRVPTILISPLITAGTVFRAPAGSPYDFDHTSFLATLCKWAGVNPASARLGTRTAVAPTFEGVIGTTARTDKPSFTVPADYAKQGGGTGAFIGIKTSAHSNQLINAHDFRAAMDDSRSPEIFAQKLEDLMKGKTGT